MKRLAIFSAILALAATPALANPCGFKERGRMVVTGYAVGQTKVPDEEKAKLAEFAETAKHRHGICVFAQVDKQGSEEANKRVADGRAKAVTDFLKSNGVPADAIKIATQEEAFTFFGLLKSDQDDDRRVMVTHD